MKHETCELYDRECIECGECERCDLDPNKICDNCCQCIESDEPYREIKIEKIIMPSKFGREKYKAKNKE